MGYNVTSNHFRYEPDVLWSDGDWEAEPEYWDSLGFLRWRWSSMLESSIAPQLALQ